MLTIKNLNKSFSRPDLSGKINIFNDANLTLQPAKTLAIMGNSGSGKSTLLSMISGLDLDYEGKIIFNGLDLKKADQNQLVDLRKNHIGIVFQQFHLMEHLNTLENVMLPLELLNNYDNIKDTAIDLLDRVGLKKRIYHFPHQLSGGEKQRVAIARSVITKRLLILADEPTGNLDENNSLIIIKLFFELVNHLNTAMIIVTHSHQIASNADQVLLINNHKLYQA